MAADAYAPTKGVVVEGNKALEDSSIVNTDAEGNGWIIKVKLEEGSVIKKLMNKEQYDKFVEEEGH